MLPLYLHVNQKPDDDEYISYCSILRYIFHHCDHMKVCRRICDQVMCCALGRTDSTSSIYRAVAEKQFHSKSTEEVFLNADTGFNEENIISLYKDYKIIFTQLQWMPVLQFAYHLSQRYGSVLDNTTFDEQISLRWDFLKELKETAKLSTLIQVRQNSQSHSDLEEYRYMKSSRSLTLFLLQSIKHMYLIKKF